MKLEILNNLTREYLFYFISILWIRAYNYHYELGEKVTLDDIADKTQKRITFEDFNLLT